MILKKHVTQLLKGRHFLKLNFKMKWSKNNEVFIAGLKWTLLIIFDDEAVAIIDLSNN